MIWGFSHASGNIRNFHAKLILKYEIWNIFAVQYFVFVKMCEIKTVAQLPSTYNIYEIHSLETAEFVVAHYTVSSHDSLENFL